MPEYKLVIQRDSYHHWVYDLTAQTEQQAIESGRGIARNHLPFIKAQVVRIIGDILPINFNVYTKTRRFSNH